MTKTAFARYEEIVIEALVKCNANLRKSLKNRSYKGIDIAYGFAKKYKLHPDGPQFQQLRAAFQAVV